MTKLHFKRRMIVLLVLLLIASGLAYAATAATRFSNGGKIYIGCDILTNSSGKDILYPNATQAEKDAFFAHLPANVTYSSGTCLGMDSSPSTHSHQECVALGGTVTSYQINPLDSTRFYMCKFPGDACPSGWNWKGGWSQTSPKSCVGDDDCWFNTCTTGSHGFENDSEIESCSYQKTKVFGVCFDGECNATRTHIGCY